MSYMDVLWIKITNSYWKWPSLAHRQSLGLCRYPSIELCNTSNGKSAAALHRDHFKLSLFRCLFLQHLRPRTEVEILADSAPAHNPQTTQQWQETNVSDFISTSDCPSASPNLNCLVVQSSGDGFEKETYH